MRTLFGKRTLASCKRLALIAALLAPATFASAQQIQEPPGNVKDCQTVRTCNFARGAEVRGCLSSYSCRNCRFVPSGSKIENGRRVQNLVIRCGFGAAPDR